MKKDGNKEVMDKFVKVVLDAFGKYSSQLTANGCHGCGDERIARDYMTFCTRCAHFFCNGCMVWCDDCQSSYCSKCFWERKCKSCGKESCKECFEKKEGVWCVACEEHFCKECFSGGKCEDCGDAFCQNCLGNGSCSSCDGALK